MTKELIFGPLESSFINLSLEELLLNLTITLILSIILGKDKFILMTRFGESTVSLPKISWADCWRKKMKGWLWNKLRVISGFNYQVLKKNWTSSTLTISTWARPSNMRWITIFSMPILNRKELNMKKVVF